MAQRAYEERRSDPDWLARRNATARRWYADLRKTDPERFQELRATKTERDRARRASFTDEDRERVRAADVERQRRRRSRGKPSEDVMTAGLTFEELRERFPDVGERSSLRHVLADEVRRGRVLLVGDVYVLNGGLSEGTKRALLDLDLVDDRH